MKSEPHNRKQQKSQDTFLPINILWGHYVQANYSSLPTITNNIIPFWRWLRWQTLLPFFLQSPKTQKWNSIFSFNNSLITSGNIDWLIDWLGVHTCPVFFAFIYLINLFVFIVYCQVGNIYLYVTSNLFFN